MPPSSALLSSPALAASPTVGSIRRLPTRVAATLVAPALVMMSAAAPVSAAAPYQRGEVVEISGTVADPGGAPVEGVAVVLMAAHRGFRLRDFRHIEEGLVVVPVTSDAEGRFRIEWPWNPYYDIFRVRAEGYAASPAAAEPGAAAQYRVLVEVDVTSRIAAGRPAAIDLEVPDASAHRAELSFASTPQTADQKRIFDEMGKPDRVDRLEMSDGEEVGWWYFERGKSFHFRDGRLDQVMEFDPVKGWPSAAADGGGS